MRFFFRQYKREIFFFIWATIVQMFCFVLTVRYGSGGFLWAADSESYLRLGENLLSHGMFVLDPAWGPTAFRTPLYPLFVAGLLWIFPKVSFVIIVQNIFSSFNVVFVYSFGKKFFNEKVAVLAAVLFSLESSRVFFSNQLMSETLFLFFFIPAFFFLAQFLFRQAPWRDLVFGAAALGIATLFRPITQLYPAFVFFFFLAVGFSSKQYKRFFFGALGVVLIYGIVISPWLIRNRLVFHEFKLSPLAGIQLYLVNAPHFLEYQAKRNGVTHEYYKELLEKLQKDLGMKIDEDHWTFESIRLMDFKYEKYLTSQFFEIIKEDPLLYTRIHLQRSVTFFLDSGASQYYSTMLYRMNAIPQFVFYPVLFWGGRLVWLLIMGIVCFGVLYAFVLKKNIWLSVFFLFTMLYFPAIAAMNWMAPRFRLSINHLIYLLFAQAFFDLFLLISRHRARWRNNLTKHTS